MDFKRLTRPFPPEQIKERLGRKNMTYKYVPSEFVVDRLNEIGTENWSFTIKESKEIANEVVVLGSLKIKDTIKEAYGSAVIDEKRTAGDSFKTASALSLVKAASLFGIPCVFHAKPANLQDNKQITQNYQQVPTAPQDNISSVNACMDCGLIISAAEIDFCKKYPQTYNNKILCRECQQTYRNKQQYMHMRRVK
jgi:hypothetical protein